jgi:hypothetical protein
MVPNKVSEESAVLILQERLIEVGKGFGMVRGTCGMKSNERKEQ